MSSETIEVIPEDFRPLQMHELYILQDGLKGPTHGYRVIKNIHDDLEAVGCRPENVSPMTVYRAIDRYLDHGLIEPAPSDDPNVDPRRKSFRTTDAGEAVLREDVAIWCASEGIEIDV